MSGRTSRFWSEPTVTSFSRISVQAELWEGRGGLSFLTYRIECKYHGVSRAQTFRNAHSQSHIRAGCAPTGPKSGRCALIPPDITRPVRRQFFSSESSGQEAKTGVNTMTAETDVNRCRARERVEREKGNGLSAEHPGSHPLSWGGERKRRTRGKRRRINQRKSRCDRRVWVMEAKGRWFITEEAGVNNIKYGKFR